ncbi:SpaA isopeptide-forming pilin-related protein [Enterococcus asini]|uniref:SpaA isopeptide-forming pilin-related protein n=1 Tax=Enterococcus asini TaxID=57732 RepID=UPI0022E947C2|nr:SpaA isopeptide-forming pilin-related protein [Enterococcus asini]
MKRVRKKLFTLSGLFMVLAQVFVMAFSGIAAIAITKDETTKNLFDVNGSSATMAYELVDNDTIKWTVSLKKGAYDSPTRFMVDLVAGESSVVPEQIQSTNQEMVFESNYGDDYIQGGFSEQVTGSMSGETTISFVTTRQISNLVVTPKLVTVPATNEAMTMAAIVTTDSTTEAEAEVQPTVASEPVNLLENVPNVTFNIPAVEEEEENNTVVPETPASEGEIEGGTEVPVDTTGTEEAGNPEVVAEEPEQEVEEGLDNEIIGPTQFQGLVALSGVQATAAVVDPFKYYPIGNSTGSYPIHGTSNHSQSGSAITQSDNIKNYNYGNGEDTDDGIPLYDTSMKGLNFTTGYHEYGNDETGRINTKKTVMPIVNEPNSFQVQLDTIGDAIRPLEDVDIVLVLDKSASMREDNPSRWAQLKSAVSSFTTSILKENELKAGRIQIGMVGFYSHYVNSTRYAVADVASFSKLPNTANSISDVTGFTSTASDIIGDTTNDTKGHPLYEDTPEKNRATPTYIGIDAGVELLHNTSAGARPTAKKVMITITDGLPTLYPVNYSLSSTDKSKADTNRTLRHSSTKYEGTGQSTNENLDACKKPNIDFAKAKYGLHKDSYFYSVGFHTGKEANDVVAALGPKGAFAANSIETLVAALKNSVANLVSTIANATIIDPMSQYVTLDEASLTTATLSLSSTGVLTASPPSDSSEIVATAKNDQVTVNNVNLGLDSSGRQGYRVTYKVTLKEAYQDGKFYPTNKTTYLVNGDGTNKYYAVPSVKLAPKDVSFTKINTLEETLEGAQFTLTGNGRTYTSNITGDDGKVTFTAVVPGDYTLTEIKTPVGHETMSPITVRVDEEGVIKKLEGDKESTLPSVTNTLKPIEITLNKKGSGEALDGATFVLKKGDNIVETFKKNGNTTGLYQLTEVTPDVYDLYETVAPEGYKALQRIGKLTIDRYGVPKFEKNSEIDQDVTVSVDSRGDTIKIAFSDINNVLKPIEVSLNKKGADGALVGATFTLQQGETIIETFSESTITEGLHQLKNLAQDTYDLYETKAPAGYKALGYIGKLTIGKHGVPTFEKNTNLDQDIKIIVDSKGDTIKISFTDIMNTIKDFDLTVNKEDDLEGKLKGAVFTLTGNGVNQQVPKTDDPETDTFTFNNLKPGTYQLTETKSPDGFVGLSESITIIISTQGDVTVSGYEVTNDPTQTESESGLPLAVAIKTTGSDNNTISFSVINKKKVPLPSTGGSGTMFFVTIGVLGLLSTGLYFLQRKDQEVA